MNYSLPLKPHMSSDRNKLIMPPEDLESLTISSGDLCTPVNSFDKEHFVYHANGSELEECEVDIDEASVEPIYQVPWFHFQYNEKAMQFLANNNFPLLFDRYTKQSEPDEEATQDGEPELEETDKIDSSEGFTCGLVMVKLSKTELANDYIKIWNNFVDKLHPIKITYNLMQYEAAYVKYMFDDAIFSIDSILNRPYCGNDRYQKFGSALFPPKNRFSKIQQRSLAKLDAENLVKHYMNERNQFIFIPIEFTSTMSRSFSCSIRLSQLTGACNKIQTPLNSNWCITDLKHPLSTMGYKASIEEELMPASNLCFINNFSKISEFLPDTGFRNKNIKNTLHNYLYLSHIFIRSEFWIENLYVKMWHYARSFCDKVQFSNRAVPEFVLITKETVFRYLVQCSTRICMAIKIWVMCEEASTYFRCWCGQKVFNDKVETRMIKRLGIGSCEMMNAQLNMQNKYRYHKKHANNSKKYHMCPCGEEFDTHKKWMQHTFSTKIHDTSKICPIVLYNFMKLSLSTENRKFQCECDAEFGDYDFWEFWLHLCSCKIMKKAANASCVCCNEYHTKAMKRANSRAGQRSRSKRQKN